MIIFTSFSYLLPLGLYQGFVWKIRVDLEEVYPNKPPVDKNFTQILTLSKNYILNKENANECPTFFY